MNHNPYSVPSSNVLTPAAAPRSMILYGVLCFLVLLVYLVVVVWAKLALGVQIPRIGLICALLVAVHFSAWRSVRASGREMLPIERSRFLFACFVAFWLIDEVPGLIRRILTVDASLFSILAKSIAATLVDLAIVALVVTLTVPWATRMYSRRAIA